jgi:TonB family protein
MAYRDDLAALEARKAAVEAELLEKTRARDEVVRLVDEARYLARAEAAFAGNRHDSMRRAGRWRGLRWLAVAAGLVAGVGGLAAHGVSRPLRPALLEVAFLQMEVYEGAMCGCTELEHPRSAECVQRVSDEMTRWGTKFMKEPPKLDEDQTKRATKIGERIGTCMVRAMTPPPEPAIAIPPPAPEPKPCDEVSCILDNYEGACCAVFKESIHTTTRSDLPDGIDRSMISAAIAKVKWRVTACADTSPARGKVKVHVKVDGAGRVAGVAVETSPDPELGACVAAAVRKAAFARTQHGGSFSYPFVF